MANEGYHEPINELSDETRDMHRAITSLMEELEGRFLRITAMRKKNMPPWCSSGSGARTRPWTRS
jgi:hypothetical protein